MKARTLHRLIGMIMLLPFLGWAVTGTVFFLKPGYADAYEILQPKLYPLVDPLSIPSAPEWIECRYLRTKLEEHLLVRTAKGWSNLNPRTLDPAPPPGEDGFKLLLEDAIAGNPARYGHIVHIDGATARTDTGISISLDWNRLSLQQRGADTDRIDWLYKIHYLQWTGIPAMDRALGLLGIGLVVVLTLLGLKLFFGRRSGESTL